MTLDERARLAVEDIQLAVDRLERETRGPLERSTGTASGASGTGG